MGPEVTVPLAAGAGRDDLRAADGRRPGRRGRATRQRLLDCTATLLGAGPYRELKVVDIARAAGTSPATFYQYFAGVESAVVVLAEEVAAQGRRFGEDVRASGWTGKRGYAATEALVDAVIAFGEEHRTVLRVVDLAADEGDGRFAIIRTHLLDDLHAALTEAIGEGQAGGRVPSVVDARATAGVLVALLAHVAAHADGVAPRGIDTADIRTATARIVFWSVSGQRPPVSS